MRDARIGVVGATGAVGTRHARAPRRARLRATCAPSRRRARPGRGAFGDGSSWSRRRRRRRSRPADSTSASSRSAPSACASSSRTPSRAARSASTSRRRTGSTDGVPLVVPEVNGDRALEHDGIVAEPELLHDPAHVRAEAAARRGRPRAACASRRTSRSRARARRRWSGCGADAGGGHDLAHGLGLRRRGVRRGVEAPRGDAEDPRAARPAGAARRACACRCSSATPRRSGSRPRSRSRPSSARELLAAAPGVRRRRPSRRRATPPAATTCSSAGSAATRRSRTGSRSSSSATTSARARRSTRSRSRELLAANAHGAGRLALAPRRSRSLERRHRMSRRYDLAVLVLRIVASRSAVRPRHVLPTDGRQLCDQPRLSASWIVARDCASARSVRESSTRVRYGRAAPGANASLTTRSTRRARPQHRLQAAELEPHELDAPGARTVRKPKSDEEVAREDRPVHEEALVRATRPPGSGTRTPRAPSRPCPAPRRSPRGRATASPTGVRRSTR